MNIVYVSNDNYAKYLGVSLYSLYKNNRLVRELDVYIVSIGISKNSIIKLKKTADKFNRSIHIIDFNNIKDKFAFRVNTLRFDISALGRLFLDDLLPKNVSRILYLDCDTLVVDNIEKLYNLNMYNKLMAAAMEPTINATIKKDISIPMNMPYYNSGVLLIDLDRYRKIHAQKRVIAYLENISNVSLFSDQDAINGAFVNLIRPFRTRYNFITNYKYWNYKTLIKLSPSYRIISKIDFEFSKKNPAIIHFAGDERPWKKWNCNPYKKLYRQYKKMSFFSDEKDEEANLIYLVLYHLLNLSTRVCPSIRLHVSNYYINKQREKVKIWYQQ